MTHKWWTVNHVLVKQNIFKCYVSSFTDGIRNKENAQVRHVLFPCDIIGRVWNLIVSVPDPYSFQFLLWNCSGYSFNIIIALVLLFSGMVALFRALYWPHCFPFTFAACCCLEQCKIKQKGKIFRTVKLQYFVLFSRKNWYFLWLVVVIVLPFFSSFPLGGNDGLQSLIVFPWIYCFSF